MVIAIVPAFNEEETISEVITRLQPFVDKVIVIDDGSRDATVERAVAAGAEVLRHQINRGQGAALETGRIAALKLFALQSDSGSSTLRLGSLQPGSGSSTDIIITFDADGQFNAEEIPALLAPIKAGECDVVLGSRFLRQLSSPLEGEAGRGLSGLSLSDSQSERAQDAKYGEAGRDLVSADKKSDIPPLRRLLLKSALIFTRLTTGLRITDTHNGFRAFSRGAAEKIHITQDKMAHASEILERIAQSGLKYKEVPVTIKYTEYSLGKGQKLGDFIKILKDLFWGKML